VAYDALELVVGLQCIAAGGHECQDPLPDLLIDPNVSEAGTNFRQQLVLGERRGTSAGHHVLGEDIEPARPEILPVALSLIDRVLGRLRLEELEAIAGYEDRPARLVEPMIGAPDPLEQARR